MKLLSIKSLPETIRIIFHHCSYRQLKDRFVNYETVFLINRNNNSIFKIPKRHHHRSSPYYLCVSCEIDKETKWQVMCVMFWSLTLREACMTTYIALRHLWPWLGVKYVLQSVEGKITVIAWATVKYYSC